MTPSQQSLAFIPSNSYVHLDYFDQNLTVLHSPFGPSSVSHRLAHSEHPEGLDPRRNALLFSPSPSPLHVQVALQALSSGIPEWALGKGTFYSSPYPNSVRNPRAVSGMGLEARTRRTRRSQMSLGQENREKKIKTKNMFFTLEEDAAEVVGPRSRGTKKAEACWRLPDGLGRTPVYSQREGGASGPVFWDPRPERSCSYRGKVSSKSLKVYFRLHASRPFASRSKANGNCNVTSR